MKQKIKPLILFVLAFAIAGYAREFFFVHLNIIMYSKYYHSPPTRPLPAVMELFNSFSYETLYYSKYAYTALFTLLYFGLNYFALKKITGNIFFTKILCYAYLFMLVLAALSMAYGYIIKDTLQDDEYTLSRWLMGIAQSPIICLILLASEKLYHKTTTQ